MQAVVFVSNNGVVFVFVTVGLVQPPPLGVLIVVDKTEAPFTVMASVSAGTNI